LAGYRFCALAEREMAGRWERYDDGSGWNASHYAVCAYPARFGETGRQTFIVSESGTIYAKETGGEPPRGLPLRPEAEGWSVAKE
jgi:hypothetical protein